MRQQGINKSHLEFLVGQSKLNLVITAIVNKTVVYKTMISVIKNT